MKSYAKRLFLSVLAVCAFSASTAPAAVGPTNNSFFSPEVFVSNNGDAYTTYYLEYFQLYTRDQSSPAYVYKYDFGWLYFFGGTSPVGDSDAYFYDFTAGDVIYTAPDLYPFFYSFNRDEFLYYLEGSKPRTFYAFRSGSYIPY